MDRQGALYGIAGGGGGPCDCGVVYKVASDGTETVLHCFNNTRAGFSGDAGLIMDRQGNFFGATSQGGKFNGGSVFQISPDGTETILHSFAGPPDGAGPYGSLILYMNKLYGTTTAGGTSAACAPHPGCGVVFEVRKAK